MIQYARAAATGVTGITRPHCFFVSFYWWGRDSWRFAHTPVAVFEHLRAGIHRPFIIFCICVLWAVCQHKCSKTKRRMDSWFFRLAHSKFLLSLLYLCMGQSVKNQGILHPSLPFLLYFLFLGIPNKFLNFCVFCVSGSRRKENSKRNDAGLVDQSIDCHFVVRYAQSTMAGIPLSLFLFFYWSAHSLSLFLVFVGADQEKENRDKG